MELAVMQGRPQYLCTARLQKQHICTPLALEHNQRASLTSRRCRQDHGELEGAVRRALSASGRQAPAPFVAKVLQLNDTFDVRFGVMLVRL
jgi:hypothetical protein